MTQRFIEAINRRDADAWAALAAPELEFRSAFLGIEGRSYRGPEGGRRYFADLAEAWERFHIEVEELSDLGDGRVVGRLRVRGRGKGSGAEFDIHITTIARVEGGKLSASQTYTDPAEARRVLRE